MRLRNYRLLALLNNNITYNYARYIRLWSFVNSCPCKISVRRHDTQYYYYYYYGKHEWQERYLIMQTFPDATV